MKIYKPFRIVLTVLIALMALYLLGYNWHSHLEPLYKYQSVRDGVEAILWGLTGALWLWCFWKYFKLRDEKRYWQQRCDEKSTEHLLLRNQNTECKKSNDDLRLNLTDLRRIISENKGKKKQR